MEIILLIGLVALFVMNRQVAERLRAVEEELAVLRAGKIAEPAIEEASPPPRSASPMAVPPSGPARVVRSLSYPADKAEPTRSAEPAEPAPAAAPAAAVKETLADLYERFVGGRLLIWIGGIALAVAGVFLVRYSIEIGLVTPPIRMIVAALFGLGLIAAGELARARGGAAGDPRIAQALVGAGILVLYAAPYGAHILYGLIGVGTVSVLMALVTAAALILSLRHGVGAAVLGLSGGFLTPMLVGDPDASAVPLLAYLGLLNVALFAVAQRRGWTWIAALAVLLSFVWTGLLLTTDRSDALAAGLFIVALSIAASLVHPGEGRQMRLLQPGAIGLLQLSLLVARTDIGLPAWLLFAALAGASLFLAQRRPEYPLLPPLALLLALVLLAAKTFTGTDPFAPYVAAAITLLFAGYAAPRAKGEGRLLWTATAAAALAAPAIILRVGEAGLMAPALWGLLLAILAAAPAALAWRQRDAARQEPRPDLPLLIAAGSAALLLAIAATELLPDRFMPAAWLAIALGAAFVARRLRDSALTLVTLAVAAAAALHILPMVDRLWSTIFGSIAAEPALASYLPGAANALLLLLLPAAFLAVTWRILPDIYPRARTALMALAGLFVGGAAYILFKQLFGLASAEDFASRGFAERLIITQALFAAGWALASGRLRFRHEKAAAWVTGFAAARFVWFDVFIHNPALVTQDVGSLPVLNLLLPAYFGTAFWLYRARRRSDAAASGIWLALFFVAIVAGGALIVRQMFQGAVLTGPELPLSEFYGYSLAGLLISMALLGAGVRLPDKALRVAGLILLTATIVKVFLVDAAQLEGLLRILSFMGLGVALIGIGKLYGKVLNAERRSAG